ncbi:MAG TPA: hypothetical protein VG939_21110 [Caulobacteraceae bacterium]|nr:hypothetical protein [Caulobacteraceae bacterium]
MVEASSARTKRRAAPKLVELNGKAPDGELKQFFNEERSRRSFGLTGYLVSGGGAGAIACWFAIDGLYGAHAPAPVMRLLFVASGLLLAAVVMAFLSALAGYKAFDDAASLPPEAFSRPVNSADRWLLMTARARFAAVLLVSLGGGAAMSAYGLLLWP